MAITELANTGSAKPYRDSKQDGKSKKKGQEDVIYLVRYMYTPYSGAYKTRKGRSREFCIKMMNAKKVYLMKKELYSLTQLHYITIVVFQEYN